MAQALPDGACAQAVLRVGCACAWQGGSDEAIAEATKASPDDPEPLTEEEAEEREELLKGGFSTWNRRDFNAFVRACEKVGLPGHCRSMDACCSAHTACRDACRCEVLAFGHVWAASWVDG